MSSGLYSGFPRVSNRLAKKTMEDSWKSRTAAIEESTSSFLPFLSFSCCPHSTSSFSSFSFSFFLFILVLLSLCFLSRIVSLLTLLISLTSRSFIFLFSFPFLNTTRRDPFPRLVSFRFLSFSRCYSLSRFGHFLYLSSLAIKLLRSTLLPVLFTLIRGLSIFFFFARILYLQMYLTIAICQYWSRNAASVTFRWIHIYKKNINKISYC